MLRNQRAYQASLFSDRDKPVFHWSDLFRGADWRPAIDIDMFTHHMGVHIYVETKPLGVLPTRVQTTLLEELASRPDTIVILCGTRPLANDLFSAAVACWTEVSANGSWRDPRKARYGSDDDFRAYMADLFLSIESRRAEAANADRFDDCA